MSAARPSLGQPAIAFSIRSRRDDPLSFLPTKISGVLGLDGGNDHGLTIDTCHLEDVIDHTAPLNPCEQATFGPGFVPAL
jgi:hypothetical protein